LFGPAFEKTELAAERGGVVKGFGGGPHGVQGLEAGFQLLTAGVDLGLKLHQLVGPAQAIGEELGFSEGRGSPGFFLKEFVDGLKNGRERKKEIDQGGWIFPQIIGAAAGFQFDEISEAILGFAEAVVGGVQLCEALIGGFFLGGIGRAKTIGVSFGAEGEEAGFEEVGIEPREARLIE